MNDYVWTVLNDGTFFGLHKKGNNSAVIFDQYGDVQEIYELDTIEDSNGECYLPAWTIEDYIGEGYDLAYKNVRIETETGDVF